MKNINTTKAEVLESVRKYIKSFGNNDKPLDNEMLNDAIDEKVDELLEVCKGYI